MIMVIAEVCGAFIDCQGDCGQRLSRPNSAEGMVLRGRLLGWLSSSSVVYLSAATCTCYDMPVVGYLQLRCTPKVATKGFPRRRAMNLPPR